MIRVNVHDAKTHLSEYLAKIEEGETVVLCRRNTPIAEIRGLPAKVRTERPIGLAAGLLKVPDSFFDPLPEDVIAGFQGHE
ncbi:MAG: type II toxin-antitoxin system Phd/YefM family antitoxin [Candidatus Eremiobacteraeota bacterium]|nr:type II toxin-antitoxin system Phd/YefM family antitoxin [Candidatus Eremiobacteraeota bacterium]